MKPQRQSQIGLDRIVRLKWLEYAAALVLAGMETPAVKTALIAELQSAFQSAHTAARGSLDKTVTILMRIWVRPPHELRPLQREGLNFLVQLPRECRVAVHWGMTMAVYPFWGAVAAHAGRLLRLQGTAAASQVQRRLREQYGERETVSRAAQRLLRSFVDWGVLVESDEQGLYRPASTVAVDQTALIAWLTEAYLRAQAMKGQALSVVLGSPSFFPFSFASVSAAHLADCSSRLHSFRHGLDEALILLRE
ncbi:hypothetical protein [Hydrogenophilus hirschii]